jgi:hypothetical protein
MNSATDHAQQRELVEGASMASVRWVDADAPGLLHECRNEGRGCPHCLAATRAAFGRGSTRMLWMSALALALASWACRCLDHV